MLYNSLSFCFLGSSAGKESTCNAGDPGSILGLGKSPGDRNSYPLQYSGLKNFMDCIIVHGVTKTWTWRSLSLFLCTANCINYVYVYAAAAAAKSLQSCLTLCDPIDGSPPGSPVPGILQARTLEWVAISFSSSWKWKVKVKSLSSVQLLATPWTAAYQAPPSMGFSRQEHWSGVPLPSPICMCIVPLFWISFPFRSPESTE